MASYAQSTTTWAKYTYRLVRWDIRIIIIFILKSPCITSLIRLKLKFNAHQIRLTSQLWMRRYAECCTIANTISEGNELTNPPPRTHRRNALSLITEPE